MRALLAIVIFAGVMLAPHSAADAGRKYKRGANPCYAMQSRQFRRPYSACARPAWRYNPYDPTGEFKGFPGWARKGFNNLRN